ncbi:Na+/H+ antiporter subunit D [Domibacillus sp. DTU_2020_1001157_1_SI_ALB_TIR_016]|uniref:Na+/H+ antiporter subunit D n=1 Tax=Domibacillus sp. DTU_2020_1001157_1_SI_ALB_TIR_016 TaxID=3077789 RepID=UPI0028ECAC3F|nr:Na+/H+ antiporter subunit D [Domibacillus sp. DTU_2020_1001157_1_SI_ALB_TIR_016]WNS78938.1 Na+/H+ antiporter subunit D [Domibacillus sp. DTU_2020_1001157_1_SI_ALB_TIR_016]
MNNILVFPMIVPILAAMLLLFFRSNRAIQRWGSVGAMTAVFLISIWILQQVMRRGILRLDFGEWLPPFGITFVADVFAMLLVTVSSLVTVLCLVYAAFAKDEKRESFFLYPFSLLLAAGVNGSFLTGDLFNLFVCFEVMLLASYALMTLGGEKKQLTEGIKYMLINILSSWLFLLGIAYLYGTLGTLNMAHLSLRIAEAGQPPLLTTISMLFLVVFSLKAGLVLYFWLPGSYSALPAAISALFAALLTKVGVYALFRTFTLLFYHEPSFTHTVIGYMAAATMIGGSIGALAHRDVRKIASYNVVIAIGFILVGLASYNEAGIQGSIYYLIHDIVIKGLLFLLVGTIIHLTGKARFDEESGLITNYPLFGWLFFIMILSLGGIPPFSGFAGKLFIGEGAVGAGHYGLTAVAFLSSLFVLYSLLRVFLIMFWGESTITSKNQVPLSKGMLASLLALGILTTVLGLGMDVLSPYISEAADVLVNPDLYIEGAMQND